MDVTVAADSRGSAWPAIGLNRSSVFIVSTGAASLLWCNAVLTTSIDAIGLNFLPMFDLMGPAFWLGWALLTVATVTWYFSERTEPFHFLLAPLWCLFLLIGPEMVQVAPRGSDLLGHLMGLTYYEYGLYENPAVGYSAFPSFHFLLLPLQQIAGLDFFEVTKISGLVFHVVRLAAILFFASMILKNKKQALLFTLIVMALMWDETNLDPSNQNMGLSLVLLTFGILLFSGSSISVRRLLFAVLAAGVITTHPLSAVMVLLILMFMLMSWIAKREFVFRRNFSELGPWVTVALFGTMTTAWLAYSSDWVFQQAVQGILSALTMGPGTDIGPSDPFAGLRTPDGLFTTSRFALMVYSFYGVLFVWGLAIGSRLEFWRQLNYQRLFPVLCLLALGLMFIAGMWGIPRYYLIGTPFIAWFLVQNMETRRLVTISLTIVLLLYAFTLRYHSEAVKHPPLSEYVVAEFVVENIPFSSTIVQGIRYGPNYKALANVVDGPQRADLVDVSEAIAIPGIDFQYAVFSDWNREHILFYWGERIWENASDYFFSKRSDIIYEDGFGTIYAYRFVQPAQ